MTNNPQPQKKSSNHTSLQRRDFPRYHTSDLNIPIYLEAMNDNKPVNSKGRILNLSEGGFLAILDREIPPNEKVNFKINIPHYNQDIKGIGRIMWGTEEKNSMYYGVRLNISNIENGEDYLINYLNNNLKQKIIERRTVNRREKQINAQNDNRKKDRRIDKPIFKKCLKYSRVELAKKNNQYFFMREIESAPENIIIRKGKKFINFASNNYLGLSYHPAVKEAAIKAIEKYGIGVESSRLLCGTMDIHLQLENKLAKFAGGEDCMIFNSGYNTNLGVISALLEKKDFVIADSITHASMIDACKLVGAKLIFYNHNDIEDLEKILNKIDYHTNKLILTDGVFSMDGDLCNLSSIYKLSQNYNAGLYLDDAHGFGVLGETGRGTTEYFNLLGKIDLCVGTMSKALGATGGFIVSTKNIIHYLKHNARSFIFSNSVPAVICATVLKSLDLIESEPKILNNLHKNIQYIKTELLNLNFDIGKTESAIIPIILNDDELVYKATGYLEEAGIFINPVTYPAVKIKESRLRISISASHTQQNIENLILKLKELKNRLKITK